jgi:DNA (cytosine-5)-methyltransferase 1
MIDLFAGAGGLTLGFSQAGFVPVLAVESDRFAAETYRRRFDPNGELATIPEPGHHVYATDIGKFVGSMHDHLPRADVVIGGPPCQGFSPLGRTGNRQRHAEMNELWRRFVDILKVVRPSVFVIENVPEFLNSDQFAAFTDLFRPGGDLSEYKLDWDVLRAEAYGVPQRRRRGITIGSRVGTPVFPNELLDGSAEKPFRTVADAISDLPLRPTDESMHWSRNPTELSLRRYALIPPGGNRFDLALRAPELLPPCWAAKPTGTTDVFGRLWADRPSVTIRTEFFKPEKGRYLHPTEDRPITHREAARLQTFPDDFVFVGSRTQVAKQIGNAVPPDLAHAIADAVKYVLESRPSPGYIDNSRFRRGRSRLATHQSELFDGYSDSAMRRPSSAALAS